MPQALELDEHYDNTDDLYCDIADRLEAVEAAAPAASLAGHLGNLNLKKDGKMKSGGGKVGGGAEAGRVLLGCTHVLLGCTAQAYCLGVLLKRLAMLYASPGADIPRHLDERCSAFGGCANRNCRLLRSLLRPFCQGVL
jgi:hypothetical protein